jgi:hypothetical protein
MQLGDGERGREVAEEGKEEEEGRGDRITKPLHVKVIFNVHIFCISRATIRKSYDDRN